MKATENAKKTYFDDKEARREKERRIRFEDLLRAGHSQVAAEPIKMKAPGIRPR